jgi:diacylglycerol O-acyltransferase
MERMAAADAWFLYLEGPTVPLHITGLLLLDPSTAPAGFSFAQLRAHVTGRLDRIPALRRRLVEVPLAIDHPCWIIDPDFDLEHHLDHVVLAEASAVELGELIGHFAEGRLDRARPLWEMLLVEGLADGRAALVMKMHHCIVDGASGMDLMAHLLDLTPSPRVRQARDTPPDRRPGTVEVVASATLHRLVTPFRPLRAMAALGSAVVHAAEASLRRRVGGTVLGAHPFNAPRTPFNATITARRAVAFGQVRLDDLKAIAHSFDVTINDVVLAACTQSLRTYLEGCGELPDRALICSVPVATPSRRDQGRAANQVSDLFVPLPVHIGDPVARLRSIHSGTMGAKQVHQALGPDLIDDVIEMAPAVLLHLASRVYSVAGLADLVAPVHNVIVSNVVGSPVPVYLAGAEVVGMYPFGPLMEGTGLNMTVLSNDGTMHIGLVACPDLVPDLEQLLDGIVAGVATLSALPRPGVPESRQAHPPA